MKLSENDHFKLFIWIPDQVGNDNPAIQEILDTLTFGEFKRGLPIRLQIVINNPCCHSENLRDEESRFFPSMTKYVASIFIGVSLTKWHTKGRKIFSDYKGWELT